MKKTKILIVEDEKALLDLYALRLEQDGYEAVKAENGQQGISLAELEKPDLILLDIIMPKVDGYEVLKSLKTNPATKKISIIVFSNLSQKEEIEKGLKLGADDFIIKTTLTPGEMAQRVKEFLGNKK